MPLLKTTDVHQADKEIVGAWLEKAVPPAAYLYALGTLLKDRQYNRFFAISLAEFNKLSVQSQSALKHLGNFGLNATPALKIDDENVKEACANFVGRRSSFANSPAHDEQQGPPRGLGSSLAAPGQTQYSTRYPSVAELPSASYPGPPLPEPQPQNVLSEPPQQPQVGLPRRELPSTTASGPASQQFSLQDALARTYTDPAGPAHDPGQSRVDEDSRYNRTFALATDLSQLRKKLGQESDMRGGHIPPSLVIVAQAAKPGPRITAAPAAADLR